MNASEYEKPKEIVDPGSRSGRDGMTHGGKEKPSLPGVAIGRTVASQSNIMSELRYDLHNIWTAILLRAPERPKTMLLCGANYGEGTSFLSYHLALLLSLEYGLKTLYVETDPEGGKPYRPLPGEERRPGFAAYFKENQPLDSLVRETDTPGFYLLPDAPPFDLAGMSHFISEKEAIRQLIAYCADHFDVTVFDGQPVHKSPRVIGFARAIDLVLFVCRYAGSRREVSKLALDKLQQGGVKISGVLLNDRQYPVPARIYRYLK